MAEEDAGINDPSLLEAGRAVARLPRTPPPADLAARTLARIARECQPVKKAMWLLRPITHPLARLAAAAAIIVALTPLTSLDIASPLGTQLERRVLGARMTDRIENWVDRLLVAGGVPGYSQAELDRMMGINRALTSSNSLPPRPSKPAAVPQV